MKKEKGKMDDTAQTAVHGDLLGFLALVNGKLILPFEELFRGELTNLQLLTLCALRESGEISVSALAQLLYIPKQQMTKVISKLEASGHITRAIDTADRRVTLVKLTEETSALLSERHERFRSNVRDIIQRYDGEQDVTRFTHSIGELNRILSSLPSHPDEYERTELTAGIKQQKSGAVV